MAIKPATQDYIEKLELVKEIEECSYKTMTIKLDLPTHKYLEAIIAKVGMSKVSFCAELLTKNIREAGELLGLIEPELGLIIGSSAHRKFLASQKEDK